MAWRIDDRWLWLGVGALTFLAVRGIRYALHEVTRLVEVSEPPQEQKESEEDQSNDISLESLKILATCDNVEIREAAINVVCARVISDKAAQDLIIKELYSPDPATREIATRAAQLIDKQLRSVAWRLPPQARSNSRRVRQWIIDPHGNGGMVEIAQPLPVGLNAGGFTRSRFREESPEEQALRRRRREAVVFNDGDRPVRPEDIIQPVDGEVAGQGAGGWN